MSVRLQGRLLLLLQQQKQKIPKNRVRRGRAEPSCVDGLPPPHRTQRETPPTVHLRSSLGCVCGGLVSRRRDFHRCGCTTAPRAHRHFFFTLSPLAQLPSFFDFCVHLSRTTSSHGRSQRPPSCLLCRFEKADTVGVHPSRVCVTVCVSVCVSVH